METTVGRRPLSGVRRSPGRAAFGTEVAERLRVLIVAGVPVGVLVAGVGGRLAMLLLRVTSRDSVRGVTSDDGFRIGQVTLGGTYSLLALGAGVGIIGVAAYRSVAPWLLGPVWFRRFTVAAASGAVVGSMLVKTEGVDFTLLGPVWLAVALFVALPAGFGALIGIVVDRVSAPDSRTRTGRRRWLLPLVLTACFPLVLVLLAVAVLVLVVSTTLRQVWPDDLTVPLPLGLLVRAAWLAIAVLGLVALLRDVEGLA